MSVETAVTIIIGVGGNEMRFFPFTRYSRIVAEHFGLIARNSPELAKFNIKPSSCRVV